MGKQFLKKVQWIALILILGCNQALATVTLSEAQEIMSLIEEAYGPIYESHGYEFQFKVELESREISAKAGLYEKKASIVIPGRVIGHPEISKDGLTLSLCHEVGHHFGGIPFQISYFRPLGPRRGPKIPKPHWASAEGQADYFATLKCLRKVWQGHYWEIPRGLDQRIVDMCEDSFDESDQKLICVRSIVTADKHVRYYSALDGVPHSANIFTPSTQIVEHTFWKHNSTQCRLDTFVQGALCPVDDNIPLDKEDPTKGNCHNPSLIDPIGLRPACWYKAKDQTID